MVSMFPHTYATHPWSYDLHDSFMRVHNNLHTLWLASISQSAELKDELHKNLPSYLVAVSAKKRTITRQTQKKESCFYRWKQAQSKTLLIWLPWHSLHYISKHTLRLASVSHSAAPKKELNIILSISRCCSICKRKKYYKVNKKWRKERCWCNYTLNGMLPVLAEVNFEKML